MSIYIALWDLGKALYKYGISIIKLLLNYYKKVVVGPSIISDSYNYFHSRRNVQLNKNEYRESDRRY